MSRRGGEGHPLDGTYMVRDVSGSARELEAVGHEVTVQRGAVEPDGEIHCGVHHSQVRYRVERWGETTIEGRIVGMAGRPDPGRFEIARLPGGPGRRIRCSISGDGPPDPGSWTADDTGGMGGGGAQGEPRTESG